MSSKQTEKIVKLFKKNVPIDITIKVDQAYLVSIRSHTPMMPDQKESVLIDFIDKHGRHQSIEAEYISTIKKHRK